MSDNRFLASFIVLSLVSGLTIGLGKIVTTLFALSLGATPFQVGIVSAMESVGMMLVTVPAGFIIARYGSRSVYFLASLGPLLVNLVMPFSASWAALAAGRGLIGLCIPFRAGPGFPPGRWSEEGSPASLWAAARAYSSSRVRGLDQ